MLGCPTSTLNYQNELYIDKSIVVVVGFVITIGALLLGRKDGTSKGTTETESVLDNGG